jgi:hypothetical protein
MIVTWPAPERGLLHHPQYCATEDGQAAARLQPGTYGMDSRRPKTRGAAAPRMGGLRLVAALPRQLRGYAPEFGGTVDRRREFRANCAKSQRAAAMDLRKVSAQ